MRITLVRFMLALSIVSPACGDDSPMIKLLKSGKVPEDRQGTIIEMLGRRGTPDDLGFVYEKVLDPQGFTPIVRQKALSALSEAALTREKLPVGDLSKLSLLIESPQSETGLRTIAITLAGLWKVAELIGPLTTVATGANTPEPTRLAAFEALATIGKPSLAILTSLVDPKVEFKQRRGAVIALAKVDLQSAIEPAVTIVREATNSQDLVEVLAPFLSRGAAKPLSEALSRAKIPADPAKRALSAVYALGRSDEELVTVLTTLAGINAEVKPLDAAALAKLVTEVETKGDPERGEQIFRRADLNCFKCHAVAGAGGGVGPELSSIGGSSPVDYLINSIMLPDQAIKEEFHTKVVATTDGQIFQGIVVDKDDNRWIIREATGELRTVPASEIDETKDGGSLMPKGLVNLLTKDDFIDLVKFLSVLGKPGPWAIHTTPTLQRLRVLKPVSEGLVAGVPNPDSFDVEVLKAPGASWLPAYALVPGTIPLKEVAEQTGSPVVYIQGEVNITEEGQLAFKLVDLAGITAWVDDHVSEDLASTTLTRGRHVLTLRVDTAMRGDRPLKVEVTKAPGSSVEYTVVGGR